MREIIKITETDLHGIISESVKKMLREHNWNFHFTNGGEHDMRPYLSDNKYHMYGRETGHFGSGTYFSTYKDSDTETKHAKETTNFNPNFIRIDNNVYRVDFDLYKNLYRVRSKRQGDVLYTLLKNVNLFHNMIVRNFGKFSKSAANYDNGKQYQIIRANAKALNLKCPSYMELTRMAESHEGVQSFSTVFMEYNGYNGVNVSGIGYYDNTKHGSVIYDLSKVDSDMEEVSPNSLLTFGDSTYDDTVVYDYFNDDAMKSLKGKINYDTIVGLKDMPLSQSMRILKNYTDSRHLIDVDMMKYLGENLLRRYISLLYHKNAPDYFGHGNLNDELVNNDFAGIIIELGAFYWVNYVNGNKSMLIAALNAFSWSLDWNLSDEEGNEQKKAFLDKIMTHLNRKLTDYEAEWIEHSYFYSEEN